MLKNTSEPLPMLTRAESGEGGSTNQLKGGSMDTNEALRGGEDA